MPTDVDAFKKAATGDKDAISQLLATYGPQVRRALSISPHWQAVVNADDVMQVTYMEAFARFGQLDAFDAESLTAWLTRVAQNNLKDAIKELERDKRPDPRQRIRPKAMDDSYVALAELLAATTGG